MAELDPVFRALADNQRRLALSHLREHQRLTLPDLAELVAEEVHQEDVSVLSAETVRDVYLLLYHEHVPVLEDAALVRYEQEEDSVTQTEHAPAALASARETLAELQAA